jgi:hypothetical protein
LSLNKDAPKSRPIETPTDRAIVAIPHVGDLPTGTNGAPHNPRHSSTVRQQQRKTAVIRNNSIRQRKFGRFVLFSESLGSARPAV